MITPKNYCVHPFNSPFIDNDGYVALCCSNLVNKIKQYHISEHKLSDIWNSPEMLEYRQQFAQQQEISGCWKCYQPELAGTSSFRSRSLDSLNNGVPFIDTRIRALDLRLGNTCNLSCIMCSPKQSNRFYSHFDTLTKFLEFPEHRIQSSKQKINPKLYDWSNHESSWDNILGSITPDLQRVYFAGGEPFYLRNFTDAVGRLRANAPHASIAINSNGTRLLRQKDIGEFSQLAHNIDIRLSVDGFSAADEFTRQGTNWQEKLAVIDQYHSLFGIQVWDITVNVFTVTTTVELIRFLKNKYPNVPFAIRAVTNIPELALPALPDQFKSELLQFLLNTPEKIVGADSVIEQLSVQYVLDDDIKRKMKLQALYWEQHGSGVKLVDFAPYLAEWLY